MRISYTGLLKFPKALIRRRRKCILMLGYEGLLLGVRHVERKRKITSTWVLINAISKGVRIVQPFQATMDGLDKIVVNSQFI